MSSFLSTDNSPSIDKSAFTCSNRSRNTSQIVLMPPGELGQHVVQQRKLPGCPGSKEPAPQFSPLAGRRRE